MAVPKALAEQSAIDWNTALDCLNTSVAVAGGVNVAAAPSLPGGLVPDGDAVAASVTTSVSVALAGAT